NRDASAAIFESIAKDQMKMVIESKPANTDRGHSRAEQRVACLQYRNRRWTARDLNENSLGTIGLNCGKRHRGVFVDGRVLKFGKEVGSRISSRLYPPAVSGKHFHALSDTGGVRNGSSATNHWIAEIKEIRIVAINNINNRYGASGSSGGVLLFGMVRNGQKNTCAPVFLNRFENNFTRCVDGHASECFKIRGQRINHRRQRPSVSGENSRGLEAAPCGLESNSTGRVDGWCTDAETGQSLFCGIDDCPGGGPITGEDGCGPSNAAQACPKRNHACIIDGYIVTEKREGAAIGQGN